MSLGGYRIMWVMVMFDLPMLTKPERKAYTDFRKRLLNDGFLMLQFSVYARPCPGEENAEVHKERIKAFLPPDGQVRMMMFTDKQFERTLVFYGKLKVKTEKAPEQLSFF